MKKSIYLLTLTLLLCLAATNSRADVAVTNNTFSQETAANTAVAQKQQQLDEMNARLQQIKAMDKSKLSHADKKELRRELKDMQRHGIDVQGAGIYFSIGALIIVLIAVILI
jgi:hypothetical protein